MSWNAFFGDTKPQDLIFYRENKSVLFVSTIREDDVIFLIVKEGMLFVVGKNGWLFE